MAEACGDDICITCSDQLVPVRVEAVSADGLTGVGVQDGERCEIALDLLPEVHVGDTVLVHGGVALQRDARAGGMHG